MTSTISRSSTTVSVPVFLSDAVCSVAHKLQTSSSIPTLCVFTFMSTLPVLLTLANTVQDRFEAYFFANSQGNTTIPQPALSILPNKVCCAVLIPVETSTQLCQDPVADWVKLATLFKSSSFLPKLKQAVRTVVVVSLAFS